jgi:hypothetical protein
MTDFTIIGREGLGIGRFLFQRRQADLAEWSVRTGGGMLGMFAEIYDPYRVPGYTFGGIKPMDPFVRREVLSHLGYKRLNFPYVHPSWQQDGKPVTVLDLCFRPEDEGLSALPAELIVRFLERYYAILPNKPAEWHAMVDELKTWKSVELRPI